MARIYNGGQWLRFTVKPPNSLDQPLFLSRDKNPRQLRTEYQTKKLGDIIRSSVGNDSTVVVRRTKGLILLDFAKVAQLDVLEDGAPNVQWKASMLQKYGLDKDNLLKQLATATQPQSAEEWIG